jgi:hypothetical protein
MASLGRISRRSGACSRRFNSRSRSGIRRVGSRVLLAWLYCLAAFHVTDPSFAGTTEFPGLEIFTHQDEDAIGKDAAGLRFTGQITAPLADALEKVLLDNGQPRFARLMLELDSEGGELDAVEKVVAVLQKVQAVATLSTRVMDGKVCASGCVALFMTGKERKASTASVWVCHGACFMHTNVPSMAATSRYLDLLTSLSVRSEFTCKHVQEG